MCFFFLLPILSRKRETKRLARIHFFFLFVKLPKHSKIVDLFSRNWTLILFKNSRKQILLLVI